MRVLGALLLVLACVLGPAAGGPAPGRQPGDLASGLDSAPAAVSAAEQSQVEAYWTDSRIHRAARPAAVPDTPDPPDTPDGGGTADADGGGVIAAGGAADRAGTAEGGGAADSAGGVAADGGGAADGAGGVAAAGGGAAEGEGATAGALAGGWLSTGRRAGSATRPLRDLYPADPQPVSRATAWPPGDPVSRAVGRVFFTLRGADYSCSGTALASRNRDTVITAGHCVNAGPGSYVRNWVFVPGYRDGRRPYGTWTARRLAAPAGWVRAGGAPDDVGFAVLNTRAGRHLTSVVGGLRIAFGRGPGRYAWVFGYPGAAPYLGRRATFCRGTSRPDPFGTPALGLACTMGAGSSGGPWLAGGGATGAAAGTVYSVTSFAYQGMTAVIWGPRLGGTAAALFAAAQRW